MAARCPGFRRLLAVTVVIGAAVLPSNSVFADIADDLVQVGISGYMKVGRPAPVLVTSTNADVKSIAFEAIDPHGNMVRYPLTEPKAGATNGARVFHGFFQVGRLDGQFRLVYTLADGTTKVRRVVAEKDEAGPVKRPLRQSVLLVMTLGQPRGFDDLASFGQDKKKKDEAAEKLKTAVRVVDLESAELFPADVRELAAVDVIVLAGRYRLSIEQDRALRQWVAEGGHLLVSRGTDLEEFIREGQRRVAARKTDVNVPPDNKELKDNSGDGLLAKWLPVTVVGQLQLLDLREVETFVGRDSRMNWHLRIPAARILDPKTEPLGAGLTPVLARTGPLVVHVPYGIGLVTFCAVDLDKPPLSTWANLDSLGKRLLEPTLAEFQLQQQAGQGRISQSGVTDLGTQLHTIQEDFPGIERMSALKTIGLLLFYIALIGPLDYLLVHRVLKRPRLTWITFPALVTVATVLTVYNAEDLNGSELRLNTVQLVDIDGTIGGETGEQPVRNTVWMTLYSPTTRRYDLQLHPQQIADDAAGTEFKPDEPSLGWDGLNESSFGGMHRTGGLDIGQLTYSFPPDSLTAKDMPIHLWSTKSLTAKWRSHSKRLVESRLIVDDFGRLTGSFTHHLPGAIDNWILVHSNQVYRSKDDGAFRSLSPHERISTDEKGVLAAGFQAVMTRLRLSATKQEYEKKTGALEGPDAVQQTAYDASDKDIVRFVHIMSFYQTVGGRKYTGLDNFSLREYDLSRLLPFNRAVLIGRLRKPTASLHQITGENDSTVIEPSRSDTFVRIILPVSIQQRNSN